LPEDIGKAISVLCIFLSIVIIIIIIVLGAADQQGLHQPRLARRNTLQFNTSNANSDLPKGNPRASYECIPRTGARVGLYVSLLPLIQGCKSHSKFPHRSPAPISFFFFSFLSFLFLLSYNQDFNNRTQHSECSSTMGPII